MVAKKKTTTRKAAAAKAPAKKVAAAKGLGKKASAKKAPTPNVGPESVVNSKFFAAARKRAEDLVKDPEKLQKIAEDSYKSGAARGGAFTAVMDDFRALIRLVVAYARGHYRAIPTDSLVTIIAGLVYVVSPLDLIPDFLPGGLVDDAVAIAWVLKAVRSELDAFRAWELGAGPVDDA